MRIVDVEPNSAEWLDWRREKLSASDAPIVAGCAPAYWPIRTVEQLRLKRRGLLNPPIDEFTRRARQYGTELEKEARRVALPQGYDPACVETDDGVFAASLDAYKVDEQRVWAEIKSPYTRTRSRLWKRMVNECPDCGSRSATKPSKQVVPEFVWWQMVHQSYVLFRDAALSRTRDLQALLIVYIFPNQYINHSISICELQQDWMQLESMWQRFTAVAD